MKQNEKMAAWFAQFMDKLVGLHPRLSGRIDWDAAKHYYYSGASVDDAVAQYCLARDIV